jgi:hypothetical protein
MYATRGDLRQHITKVHRCGIYANIPAGGLSIRQKSYLPSKDSHLSREIVYVVDSDWTSTSTNTYYLINLLWTCTQV